jgi:ATP-dependent Clp protease ATP-binding subunit ClpB
MTSNLGSHLILEERDATRREQAVMELVRKHFRPEFINRIDEMVIFSHLEQKQLRGIVNNYIEKLNQALKERGLSLMLTDSAIELLCERGYDRDYGARPMKRVFQRDIQNPLAMEILAGKYEPGSSILVDVSGGQFRFQNAAAVTQMNQTA